MLAVVLIVIPGGFGLLLWKSYRHARVHGFEPRTGERWTPSDTE